MSDEQAQKESRQVRIHRADIPPEISAKGIEKINEAMDKFQIEKDMATYVKKKCDEEFGGTWHCVVGRNFGCSITHDTKYVFFF
eukprot:CAMPEP_0116955414 /NCGR_PEP_ID=MMETSP0467-20121206/42608_1 /TAXON_ID=283647 /ORGANISM="Mesodinium pulex, Strain SPMC105" /LENGTH=83 /DNA_ID=CAMNT_0004641461 /DNA_START=60 /DNA_END=308 /DNA_ORIENTATION=+